ncbi:nuclease HARBI1-like protein [Trifolium pratense]|uniref:Nuclease HARBI1-like protein n=1 Tax=Trifolium pratense TaxID=57577 RepID=A0A2K3MX41_TRIPR|nr:nuclease HARBI1-like protein [Trifolium pratense]
MVAAKHKPPKKKKKSYTNQNNLFALISKVTQTAQSFLSQNDLTLLPSQSLILDSLISSTSHSLSLLLKPSHPLFLSSTPQHNSWFHRFISSTSVSDSRWLDAFRMSNPSFFHLLDLLSPSLTSSIPNISPDFALAAAIFRLAHGAGYSSVARRFGISPSDACRAFFVVCKAVNDNLGNLFELRTDSDRVVVGFGFNSLPNCFGVLGLAGFEIEDESLSKNRFLMVQALVDSEGRFLDVSAGWPNSIKPETILHESKLYHDIEKSKELLQGPSYKLNDGSLIPQYILGDSCFPLLPWLLTPYNRVNEEDSFSSTENAFNCAHNRAMGLFGDAFGRLRTRWQLLSDSRKWKRECVEYLPFVVVTGCLLHNFLIKCNDPLLRDKGVSCVEKEGDDVLASEGVVDESAARIRDALALHLSKVSLRR